MKTIILTEISESLSAHEYLHNSITKMVFEWYTKFSASEWLGQYWGKYITDITEHNLYLEIDPVQLEGDTVAFNVNRETLKKLCYLFLDTILKELNKSPRPLWEFASILANYTSQDALQFIFVKFFAMA